MTRALTFALLVLFTPFALSAQYDISAPARVVAFADVHGAYEDWITLLQEVGVIDAQLNWSGGNTHLVSLGDLVDRGPGSRKVVELLMQLDQQAERAGGAVHLTLGNHEVMLMTGDLRYVSPPEFAAFAADETPGERDAMFAQYLAFNPEANTPDARQRFDTLFPPGYIALRKAFSTEGKLGAWLIEQPFVIKVNDKVYLHGGIAGIAAEDSLETLNEKMQGELTSFLSAMNTLRAAGVMPWYVDYHDRLMFLTARVEEYQAANPGSRADWFPAIQQVFDAQTAFVFSEQSLNWYRGTALCHPYSESFNTERFLKRIGASQLVMGHTPTTGNVHERMEGLAIRLDTGMLTSVYNGRASALISDGDKSYVHYLGSEEQAQPTAEIRSISQEISGMSDAELEHFMRTAPVVNVEDIGTGITKPKKITQQLDGISNDAVFKYEDTDKGLESRSRYKASKHDISDRYGYDVAAYKVDRMLDLQMVPTAVIAQVEGQEGALSDWIDSVMTERDRADQEIPFSGYCAQFEQYRLRYIYDILIHNDDRNLTNILWTKDDFMLQFIDHSRAFRSSKRRPEQYKKSDLRVSDLLRSHLLYLNEENLTEELSPYLHPKQIEAILARRDLILREAQNTSP